jgi:hypothetical protein
MAQADAADDPRIFLLELIAVHRIVEEIREISKDVEPVRHHIRGDSVDGVAGGTLKIGRYAVQQRLENLNAECHSYYIARIRM